MSKEDSFLITRRFQRLRPPDGRSRSPKAGNTVHASMARQSLAATPRNAAEIGRGTSKTRWRSEGSRSAAHKRDGNVINVDAVELS